MKILKDGAFPMPPPLWPVGSAFRCHHCHCEFLIDDTSSFRRETEERVGGDSFAYFVCPTCEREVVADRPRHSSLQSCFSMSPQRNESTAK